jgi:futalosine hydrolase
MRILIVSATAAEIAPLVAALGGASESGRPGCPGSYRRNDLEVDVLVTGVGMVSTAAWCARALAVSRYDAALNLGLCGAFDRSLEPGAVVHVVADRISELGAEDGDAFLALDQLGLGGESEFRNPSPPRNAALEKLPRVNGITVNTVHGNERSIAAVVERFRPQVESMEGAAFMCACSIQQVPFAQVRAVSNLVERRHAAAWKMSDAVQRLNEAALRMLDDPW